ncbi:hypothetical protein HYS93_02000 [Candidatus Daviesbacteria bacterium]|nr:hypothetical protein [Candidatus Daviesbacteria bacterium]
MTATAHALVGASIAATVPDPALGITLAAASHPILDLIPHWDFGRDWRKKSKIKLFVQAAFDLSLGFVLAYLLFGDGVDFWYLFACIFASEVWDIIEAPYWFFNWDFPPFSWLYEVGHTIQGRAKLPMGILTQVVTVGVVFVALRIFFRVP